MNERNDQRIQALARRALNRDIGTLDANVSARLASARRRALDHVRPGQRWGSMAGWAVAASVLLALNLWWWQMPAGNDVSADDFEMLVSGEQIELYEDLDFYHWVGADNDAS